MTGFTRGLIRTVVILVLTVAIGFGAVFLLSESKLRDVARPQPFTRAIDADSATIEHGRHIARTRGCFGCHGQQLEGAVFTDEWDWVDRAVAPNLAEYARTHDAATLERAIRHAIGADGRGFWSMPGYNWVHLSDADVAALIAFLRAAPVVPNELPSPKLGWTARWELATGREDHLARWAELVPPLRTDLTDPQLIRGEYLAMTTCNECHGLDLRGENRYDFPTPDLAIVAGYPEEAFRRLMKEGISADGRDNLELMSMIARDRFAYWTDQELTDLYRFLTTLVDEPVPEGVFWRPTSP